MVVKTFRGKIADGGYDQIRLSTTQGKVGYRIVKLEIVTSAPSTTSEHLCQVWSVEAAAIAGATASTIDFTQNELLAVALWSNDSSAATYSEDLHVIFDNIIFNQDIFISNQTINGSNDCNYHMELEVIPLNEQSAEYTTLKDIRAHG